MAIGHTPEHAPHIPHLPLPDIKGRLRWVGKHWKPVGSVGLVVATLGTAGYLWITHDRGPQNPPIQPTVLASDTFNRPDSGLGVVIPEITPPTPTPEPIPTSTPEAKKDVPCGILPPEYCSKAERVSYELNGKSYTFIGINLPPDVSIPLYAAEKGDLDLGVESQPFSGKSANVKTATGENFDLRGNIDTSKWGKLTGADVNAGDILGYARTSQNKSLGKYDVVFTITRASPTGPEVVEDKLRKLFPAAFQSDSQTFSSTELPKSVGIRYLDKGESPN